MACEYCEIDAEEGCNQNGQLDTFYRVPTTGGGNARLSCDLYLDVYDDGRACLLCTPTYRDFEFIEDEVKVVINYCPICGRKLKKD